MQTFVTCCSEILIDEPVRVCRGSDGGDFNRLIHISWSPYIIPSTSVFQPSAWFMKEIWIETKTLTNTNAEWLIFKWQLRFHCRYHRSLAQYFLSWWISPCPISLFCQFTVKLTPRPCVCAIRRQCDLCTYWFINISFMKFGYLFMISSVRLTPSVPVPIFTESWHSRGSSNYNTGTGRSDRLL